MGFQSHTPQNISPKMRPILAALAARPTGYHGNNIDPPEGAEVNPIGTGSRQLTTSGGTSDVLGGIFYYPPTFPPKSRSEGLTNGMSAWGDVG